MSAVAGVDRQTSHSPQSSSETLRLAGIGAVLLVVYLLTARFGFQFAFVSEQVTTVWAPTGIAQAALLLWGRRLWPAVWLGAFLANVGSSAPMWTALAVATGNTFEAVVAATLLQRTSGFDLTFQRMRDVSAFVGVATILSTAISATAGALTLSAAMVQPWERFGTVWLDWWLGDALGSIIIAPAILTIVRSRALWKPRQLVEAVLLAGGAFLIIGLLQNGIAGAALETRSLEFVMFPLVIAAAVRLPPAGATLVVLSAALAVISNTNGGPAEDAHRELILLQAFMGVLAVTGLLLAAAIAERRTGERRRAVAYAVGDVLTGADDLSQVAPALLRSVGTHLDWPISALWVYDYERQYLRCESMWTSGSRRATGFVKASTEMALPPGIGLPGRVWTSRQPEWVEDVVKDPNFPRADHARTADLHGAFAFPIENAGELIGVVECFNRTILAPDQDLLRTMSGVGQQIGAFVGRRREEQLRAQAQRERELLLERELSARRHAEAANRAKDEFLATLSHELRTPLNAIAGWTRMLLDGAVDAKNMRRALEVIDRNAKLQTQLVGDILDVSRIITGNLRLNRRPCDLGAVVSAALDAVRPAAEARQVQLRPALPASPLHFEGDGERLQQVAWNLLSNAVKFTPSGGAVDVEVVLSPSGHVLLRVEDNGAGIDRAFLPYVFDRFTQADSSGTRQHGGLGLGLAIVRHIVELHGGTVRAESEGPGTGARFVVELPWTDRTPGRR